MIVIPTKLGHLYIKSSYRIIIGPDNAFGWPKIVFLSKDENFRRPSPTG